jgi:hypothetical protein
MRIDSEKSGIPGSLRRLPGWFLTGKVPLLPGRMTTTRYSPKTMAELRWDQYADFTTYDDAVDAMSGHPFLDGLGFKLTKPYLGVIIVNCIDELGHYPRWHFQEFARNVGGYWEKQSNGRDVLGILVCDTNLSFEFALYRGNIFAFIGEGVCVITGNALPGLAGDPALANAMELYRMYGRTNRRSEDLSRILNPNSSGRR